MRGHGTASAAAPPERCLEFLGDVEAYPSWYPDVVRSVRVLDRDGEGRAERVRATLHAAVGPIARDLDVVLVVSRGTSTVKLTREPHQLSDPERFEVTWRVDGSEQEATRLEVALNAALEMPRLVPLGGVGDAMAGGFVRAAARALKDPSA